MSHSGGYSERQRLTEKEKKYAHPRVEKYSERDRYSRREDSHAHSLEEKYSDRDRYSRREDSHAHHREEKYSQRYRYAQREDSHAHHRKEKYSERDRYARREDSHAHHREEKYSERDRYARREDSHAHHREEKYSEMDRSDSRRDKYEHHREDKYSRRDRYAQSEEKCLGRDRQALSISVHQREGKDAPREEKYAYPWKGIVANIPTEFKDGRRVGDSGSKLKDELTQKGFDPVKVNPLWNHHGHSGYAVVNFKKDWDGFNNAIMFERSFEVDHCGKKDYLRLDGSSKPEGVLYGWVAREDDFYRIEYDIVGKHLKDNGDLKTLSEIQAEEERKNSTLVTSLSNTLKEKDGLLGNLQHKYRKTKSSVDRLMENNDRMVRHHNEEMEKLQLYARHHFERISLEHNEMKRELEAEKLELKKKESELYKREKRNDKDLKKILLQKKQNEMATQEQNKADDEVMKLAEKHQLEKEERHKKIIELEKKVDAKQALELEIERMKGRLEVMQHMGEEDADNRKKMDEIREELKEKEEEYESLEDLNQALIVKERRSNDELQEARKELIKGLGEPTARTIIGVKTMGHLDIKTFSAAMCRKIDRKKEAMDKAKELHAYWQSHLGDTDWHPFRVVTNDDGNSKEFLDESDEKLMALKNEGEEVYEAVTRALRELNEYNPSGRYPVRELYNFQEKRRASLKEGAEYILKQWSKHKKKKA